MTFFNFYLAILCTACTMLSRQTPRTAPPCKMSVRLYVCYIYEVNATFLSRDTMHSVLHAVSRCLSVRPSVRPSQHSIAVPNVSPYCIETTKHILKLFSPTIYFFHATHYGEIQNEIPLNGGVEKARGVWKNRDFRPIPRFISETIQDRAKVTVECL